MNLRDVLIRELDLMLARDGGPDEMHLIEISLQQGDPQTITRHASVVSPAGTVVRRYVNKTHVREEEF